MKHIKCGVPGCDMNVESQIAPAPWDTTCFVHWIDYKEIRNYTKRRYFSELKLSPEDIQDIIHGMLGDCL